jgi:cobalt-precorrin 5A hydrolase/precorrin-3B C17-methyltransferase
LNKSSAVTVVVDDAGSFSISLLSGHLGGANELARKIASLLDAHPVITTASDIDETLSIDLLGNEFGWVLEDNTDVNTVSAALVNGEMIGIYQDAGERGWWPETKWLPDNIHTLKTLKNLARARLSAALLITDKILNDTDIRALPAHTLTYRPRSLVLGIGCNRGTLCAEIEAAVDAVFTKYSLSTKSIRNIATITLKKNEAGLQEYAQKHNLPVYYFDKDTLNKADFPSKPSATVLKHTGTPSVGESAALLSSEANSLVIPKVSYNRKVTIAVARLDFHSIKINSNKLFLVGIGPGSPEHMTFKARQAIERSDAVIGYNAYIDLIKPFINGKEVIATGMGAEIERVKKAIDIVKKGKAVSIISSGDSGIYGMAGLVGEMLCAQSLDNIDMEVIPGVPVLAAGAALLGAPLNGDFVAISLSDYLVSWEEISQRLQLSAQAGFIIVLYNPRSKKRLYQLDEAIDIIQQIRRPDTPAGIVYNAYREGQKVIITDLQHLLDYKIDMNTIIIIGNANTFTFNNWMVTPRGYDKKYNLKKKTSRKLISGKNKA